MRLISLLLGLAALIWVIYTYKDSETGIKTGDADTVKQQYQKSMDEAKQAASALQKSLDEQARRLRQSTE